MNSIAITDNFYECRMYECMKIKIYGKKSILGIRLGAALKGIYSWSLNNQEYLFSALE